MSVTAAKMPSLILKEYWQPHDYQLTASSFLLCNKFSGLFLDPGLGKTSISLSAMLMLKLSGEMKGVLLIAPLRVCYSVWPGEINKWANFSGLIYTILHASNRKALYGQKKDIYIINPEGLPWLYNELVSIYRNGGEAPFDVLWIDESTKFKSPTAKTRFKTIVDMLPLFKRRHIMTGTPAPKGLIDLWSQIFILDEGKSLKPNFYRFRNTYFETDDWNKYNWRLREGAEKAIHEAIAPLVLEMSAEDYLDIPEITYNNIEVELPKKAMEIYKSMENEMFIEHDSMQATATTRATSRMKCHQIANGAIYEDTGEDKEIKRNTIIIHKAKIDAINDLIDELAGKPLLVAYKYRHDLDALRQALGNDTPHIGSGVQPARAKELEAAWNAGQLPILLGHPASMGHGLNLQGAGNDICWYSMTEDCEEYIQFNKRIHRQGVKGKVRCHHILAKGTIDYMMLSRLGSKAAMQMDLRQAIKEYRERLYATV